MPIYAYGCEPCGVESEVIQPIGAEDPKCLECGVAMVKKPTCHAFVYMEGKGGYPSFRKRYMGTAPNTSRILPGETKGGPGSNRPDAKLQGEKWLEKMF
tara:strand:+ start:12286 stop:12582 length:297 start_codon:yes stop_codon:yes gene_type:complete